MDGLFPSRLPFQVRKVMGGGGVVACRIIVFAPVPVPFLWTLDLGFWTWILDLDFGLGFGTRLGLDNRMYRIYIIMSIDFNILILF